MTSTLALFDASYPASLSMMARVGALGVPIDVYSPDGLGMARFSRHCRQHGQAPSPEALDSFIPWLRQRLASGAISAVVPSSDNLVYALAVLRDQLSPGQQALTPSVELALDALLKDRFHRRCSELGIAVPRTWYPGSIDDAAALAPSLQYPVVLKPRAHIGVSMAERGRVLWSAADVHEHFRPYPGAPEAASLLAAHPELRWPMLQSYLPPPEWRNVSVCGFRHPDGRVLAAMAAEKTGQWPPGTGVGTAFRAVDDPELVRTGVHLVESFGITGMFDIEFQRRGGERLAIDLNVRAFGMLSLPIACGLDLPQLWWRSAHGEAPAASLPVRTDLVWRNAVPWHLAMWAAILRGPQRGARLAGYLHQLGQPSVGPVPAGSGRRLLLRYRLRTMRGLPQLLRNYLRAPRSNVIEHWS